MKKVFLVLLVLLLGCSVNNQTMEHDDGLRDFEIGPYELSKMIENDDFKLIDVREISEYNEGHLEGTMLLSVNEISQARLDELGVERDDKVIVYCRSGKRSERAYNMLKELGYNDVKSLGGGIVHWEEDGYKIEYDAYKEPAAGKKEAVEGPMFFAESKEHDFGMIKKEEGVVETTFVVENRGNEDLELSYAGSSCGCTKGEIEKNLLKPGEKTSVVVSFDPNYHKEPEGRFSRTVFIETNDGNKEVELKIYAEIEK
jgi:phage shock protein E